MSTTTQTPTLSLITRFTHEAINPPKMPKEIRELVLPAQLGLPMVEPVDRPLRRSKKERRRERLALVPPQQQRIIGEEGDTGDAESAIQEEVEGLVSQIPSTRKSRYIPNFDVTTNRCWWDWVPFELDEDGKQKYDFEYESNRAYADFFAENARREKLRTVWWNQNPQSGYTATRT